MFITACPSYYEVQPPTELHCNPMGALIALQCGSRRRTDNVTWYWSQCVHDAGVNGTAILPGDTTDVYGVDVFGYGNYYQRVSFLVTGSTLGYYWCEISSAVTVPLRPSIITPVLQPVNTSPDCTLRTVKNAHNLNFGPECAAEGSPTIYTRVPLPSFCPSVRKHSASHGSLSIPTIQPTCGNTIFSNEPNTQLIVIVAVCLTLVTVAVLVIVVLSVCLCCKSRQLTRYSGNVNQILFVIDMPTSQNII